MKEEQINIKFKVFEMSELSVEDRDLVEKAAEITRKSYSPYSHFKVGCAVRLSDGNIVTGANQENSAYPSGLCAERVALFNAGMQDADVECIAISAEDEKGDCATAYPCGACRQVMSETQTKRTQHPIRILIHRKDNTVLQADCVEDLLPLSFDF